MMPTAGERLILAACHEMSAQGFGFTLDSEISKRTGATVALVRDYLLGLDREELVDLVPLEDGGLKASVTPKGRQELAKGRKNLHGQPPLADGRSPLKIVPKGLRAFDEHDKDFFLELLPGPRRADGLPDCVHFWKVSIEQMDADRTFRVGLIYGPSGCGKSSLVKAGLLPRLANHVLEVDLAANAVGTEAHLLNRLRNRCSDLPMDLALADSVSALCEGRGLSCGTKVLIVLDQFEQWLSTWRSDEESHLIAALRHCDGSHVQAIVIVRDDFWMAVNRFEKQLGLEFRRTLNSYGLDLFDPIHALKVLADFGVGFGRLPEDLRAMSDDQNRFLTQTIKGLKEDDRIAPVRLSMFAWMVRGKLWNLDTLKQVGGTEGVGVKFLEEMFSLSIAEPKYRQHQKAAQEVLRTLLPEGVNRIRGGPKSRSELMVVSGYAQRPRDFDELSCILEEEVRLISKTEPEGPGEDHLQRPNHPHEPYYHLTHDYLVPAVRDWLTQKKGETERGRAELLLSELTTSWKQRSLLRSEAVYLAQPNEMEYLLRQFDPNSLEGDDRLFLIRSARARLNATYLRNSLFLNLYAYLGLLLCFVIFFCIFITVKFEPTGFGRFIVLSTIIASAIGLILIVLNMTIGNSLRYSSFQKDDAYTINMLNHIHHKLNKSRYE
jgi:hypothetical protein